MGVLVVRALLCGVYVRARDFWKLLFGISLRRCRASQCHLLGAQEVYFRVSLSDLRVIFTRAPSA